MNFLSFIFLMICLFIIYKRALFLPTGIKERETDQGESLSKIFIPESNGAEEGNEESPVFIMLPVVGDRPRRGIYDTSNIMNLENVSYDVPTYIKFNESAKGDVEVRLVPDLQLQQKHVGVVGALGNGNGGPNNNCCPMPQKQNLTTVLNPKQPMCLTINLENIFPPGKAESMAITNSSEIRGNGAVLRVNFLESKSAQCPTDIFANFDSSPDTKERMESQKKKKVEEEEEDEEDDGTTQIVDQKSLQEIILKILMSNKNCSSTSAPEEMIYIENSTGEPSFTFLINSNFFHKMSGKHGAFATTGRPTTFKNMNQPDFDSLLSKVEHMTPILPKEKLLSLISNLINKATLNKEVPSNQ